MAKFKLIALTTPVAGREAEFHAWYQDVHLPELCAMPGVLGAQRYQLLAKLTGSDTNPWMAIYDIECEDPMVFLGALGQASASGRMTPSDATDMATNYTAMFCEHGEGSWRPADDAPRPGPRSGGMSLVTALQRLLLASGRNAIGVG